MISRARVSEQHTHNPAHKNGQARSHVGVHNVEMLGGATWLINWPGHVLSRTGSAQAKAPASKPVQKISCLLLACCCICIISSGTDRSCTRRGRQTHHSSLGTPANAQTKHALTNLYILSLRFCGGTISYRFVWACSDPCFLVPSIPFRSGFGLVGVKKPL